MKWPEQLDLIRYISLEKFESKKKADGLPENCKECPFVKQHMKNLDTIGEYLSKN